MRSEKTVSDYLRWAAMRQPHKLAYAYARQEHTWREVDRRVNRLARTLQALGIRAGEVVACCCRDGPVLVETIFAAARMGAIRVGVNYRYSPGEIEKLLQHSGARVVFVQEDFRSLIPTGIRSVSCGDAQLELGELGELSRRQSEEPLDVAVDEESIAQICYTTGSTGTPKGAVLTHRMASHVMAHALLELGITSDDVWLHCLPGAATPSMMAVWNALIACTNVVQEGFDATSALQAIQKYKVTRTIWIPTMLTAVCAAAESQKFQVSSLRRISYGSAPTPPALIRRALRIFEGAKFDQWYGSTEGAGGWYTQLTPADHDRALAGEERLLESCGRPTHHAEVRILDGDGRTLPAGQVGEVCVRGVFVMREYFGEPDITRQAFKDGWLHTGDMGRMDEEGYLFLVDRKHFMIITGGYNVYPVEVENVLTEHPEVLEACVFGIPDERWGEAVQALVVLREDAISTGADIKAWCHGRLAEFKIPRSVRVCQTLLRGATGKIQKRAIRENFLIQAAVPRAE